MDSLSSAGCPVDAVRTWLLDDDRYMCLSRNWAEIQLPKLWRNARSSLGLAARPQAFDCDDYANTAKTWVSMGHAESSPEDAGVAFGTVDYMDIQFGKHRINFAVVNDGGDDMKLGIVFFDAVRGSVLVLMKNEKDSITAIHV